MKEWVSHAACAPCYGAMHPGRDPYALVDPPLEDCCYCGEPTAAGIYVRGRRSDAPHCSCKDD